MTDIRQEVLRGQAVYSKRVLSAYDLVVLGISNRWIWRCPTSRLLDLYDAHMSRNHLDVGVGTGYFLDRSRTLSQGARIALMDLNQNSLEFAARRIARFRPELYRRNVLEPLSFDGESFDSVGINYLLHCLPGSIDAKARVLDHLQALMNPGAGIFGSTLLHNGVPRGVLAARLMKIYNDRGIFSNRGDDLPGLERVLRQRFRDVSVEVVGCAALFSGRVRTRARITL
ncbi:MAG TPA: class I SAM-dependent methyltransferase [Gemmatimonadaceae bacterium]|nr:class I SAM-dependent methyltransferase [Gemmatimonadaceae bacterium]